MVTIRQEGETPVAFVEVVEALVLTFATGRVEEPTPDGFSSFTGAEAFAVPQTEAEVFGTDLGYAEIDGRLNVVSGRIERIDFVVDENTTARVTGLALDAEAFILQAAEALAAGASEDEAVASVLLGYDYDFLGSGADEEARPSERVGDARFDPMGDDLLILGDGRHELFAGAGDDVVVSGGSDDWLRGGRGDDRITPGRGDDRVRGDGGEDTVVLAGLSGGGHALVRGDAIRGDRVYALDRADGSRDTITGAERFTDGTQTIALDEVPAFDPLAYAAANPDAVGDLGTDAEALLRDYLREGFEAGRGLDFDAVQYLDNHADLRDAFGQDAAAATRHYVVNGAREGRLAEDPLAYVASFEDLSAAFGGLSDASVAQAGLTHHRRFGADEGRTGGVDFDAAAYLANHADLQDAFGDDEAAATLHYIRSGREAGRLAEDGLAYLASFDDLVLAAADRGLETEAELRAFAAEHFRRSGEAEGRDDRVDFDAEAYLANYADLRAAFADGTGGYDAEAATLHWILSGFSAGRTDEPLMG